MIPRQHTPDRIETTETGQRRTSMTLKRACNGCGHLLGDVDGRDIDRRGNLTDVRPECPNCQPLVALEYAGCTTWQLTRRSITETSFYRWKRYARPHREPAGDGTHALAGLVFNAGPGHEDVTVRWGDWLVKHPDGHFTVHHAPAAQETTR